MADQKSYTLDEWANSFYNTLKQPETPQSKPYRDFGMDLIQQVKEGRRPALSKQQLWEMTVQKFPHLGQEVRISDLPQATPLPVRREPRHDTLKGPPSPQSALEAPLAGFLRPVTEKVTRFLAGTKPPQSGKAAPVERLRERRREQAQDASPVRTVVGAMGSTQVPPAPPPAPPLAYASTLPAEPVGAFAMQRQIQMGIQQGLMDTGINLTSPMNLGLLFAGGLGKALTVRSPRIAAALKAAVEGTFSYQQIKEALGGEFPEVIEAFDKGDYYGFGRHLALAGAGLAMGTAAGRGALKNAKRVATGAVPPGSTEARRQYLQRQRALEREVPERGRPLTGTPPHESDAAIAALRSSPGAMVTDVPQPVETRDIPGWKAPERAPGAGGPPLGDVTTRSGRRIRGTERVSGATPEQEVSARASEAVRGTDRRAYSRRHPSEAIDAEIGRLQENINDDLRNLEGERQRIAEAENSVWSRRYEYDEAKRALEADPHNADAQAVVANYELDQRTAERARELLDSWERRITGSEARIAELLTQRGQIAYTPPPPAQYPALPAGAPPARQTFPLQGYDAERGTMLPAPRTHTPIDQLGRASGMPLDRVNEMAGMTVEALRERQQYLRRVLESEISRLPDPAQTGGAKEVDRRYDRGLGVVGEDASGKPIPGAEAPLADASQVPMDTNSPAFRARQEAQRELKLIDLLIEDKLQQSGIARPPGPVYGAAPGESVVDLRNTPPPPKVPSVTPGMELSRVPKPGESPFPPPIPDQTPKAQPPPPVSPAEQWSRIPAQEQERIARMMLEEAGLRDITPEEVRSVMGEIASMLKAGSSPENILFPEALRIWEQYASKPETTAPPTPAPPLRPSPRITAVPQTGLPTSSPLPRRVGLLPPGGAEKNLLPELAQQTGVPLEHLQEAWGQPREILQNAVDQMLPMRSQVRGRQLNELNALIEAYQNILRIQGGESVAFTPPTPARPRVGPKGWEPPAPKPPAAGAPPKPRKAKKPAAPPAPPPAPPAGIPPKGTKAVKPKRGASPGGAGTPPPAKRRGGSKSSGTTPPRAPTPAPNPTPAPQSNVGHGIPIEDAKVIVDNLKRSGHPRATIKAVTGTGEPGFEGEFDTADLTPETLMEVLRTVRGISGLELAASGGAMRPYRGFRGIGVETPPPPKR